MPLSLSTRRRMRHACALALLLFAPTVAGAEPTLDAAASDPNGMGWMQGFPPPEGRIIRATDPDFFSFPKLRWTVCHLRRLMPTMGVSRVPGATVPFARAPDPSIADVTFTPLGGGTEMTFADAHAANYTDGIIVLHEGRIVYERTFGCLEPAGKHAAMSVTKSFTGLLAEILVAEGTLDETATVSSIIPELAGSGFGDATVRQVMDMTTGIRFSEDYADPDADIWAYSAATSFLPTPGGEAGPRSFYEYLPTVRSDGRHGEAFGYRTVNSDVLGWILARTSGRSVAALLSERIWRPMGAEQAAYYTMDSIGVPFAGGGLVAGLRDMARVGQIVLDEGVFRGERLFPAEAVRSIRGGGDRTAFAKAGFDLLEGWSYRGMWWVSHDANGSFSARGVHGQRLWIDPAARVVIVRFASHPLAGNAANDPTTIPAFRAVADHLATAR